MVPVLCCGKSRRNISDLMDIRPDYANIERDGKLEQVDPDEVGIGTIIVVQPGEKVPIDGMVVQGESTLNTAALTGESLPREVKTGDEIISGCINMTGLLHIQTTKEFGESTVSKILDLVENASSRKSKSEDFISRFAKIYTPAVCYAALALAILPPLVRMFGMGLDAGWETWVYRALTFLVALYRYTADYDKKYAFDIERFLSHRLKLKPDDAVEVYQADLSGEPVA